MAILICIFAFASTAPAQTLYTTNSGYIAAVSERALDVALSYIAAGDYAALQKLRDANLAFVLAPYLDVYITDMKAFSGKIKIRLVGEVAEIWTLTEAVSRK